MAKKNRERSSVRSPKSSTLAAAAFKIKPDVISFEDEPTANSRTFQDHIMLLYGAPKIGKTTLASKIPGAYFLPTEPGYHNLMVRKTRISNWVTFIRFIQKMEKSPNKVESVGCWIIDTADNLAKFCMQFTCGRAGIAHPSDEEWGKGWEAYRDEFTHWILRLIALNPGTIFISHETERDIVYKSVKISKAFPALPKTCYTIINNLSDLILHMTYEESTGKKRKGKKRKTTKRVLWTKPDAYRDAGDRTKLLPDKIYFSKEQDAVDEIIGCFAWEGGSE